jgi:hypothetical protein
MLSVRFCFGSCGCYVWEVQTSLGICKLEVGILEVVVLEVVVLEVVVLEVVVLEVGILDGWSSVCVPDTGSQMLLHLSAELFDYAHAVKPLSSLEFVPVGQ